MMKTNPNPILARTVIHGRYAVSTVQLLGVTFDAQKFETMVFACDDEGTVTNWQELDCDRYATAKEALAGHAVMVATWAGKINKI